VTAPARPTSGQTRKAGEPATIPAVIERAYHELPHDDWDHLVGGAGEEITLRRNRLAFDRIALRPRLLRDGTARHAQTAFLGESLALPVMLAPIGSIARYHPEGTVGCARAAHRVGTVAFISCLALPALEHVRRVTSGPLVSQIYLRGARQDALREIRRAEVLGCRAVCLTADLAAPGRRDRQREEPNHREGRDLAGRNPPHHPALYSLFDSEELFTWADLDVLRNETTLPLILKGVTSADDARIGVECGVDVIYVSNHGGRIVDHVASTMEVLPEIIAAVDGRADVIIDSGFVRGSDVVKAICLGARAVLIGKLAGWAMAVGGETGLVRVLEFLQREILEVMAHVGARSTQDLDESLVTATFAAPASDWIGFAVAARRPRQALAGAAGEEESPGGADAG
jgi:isopentenyl diphosphate isomerase/L-lactate dehydrogenase-like FMN-dependent dehydrogenase